MAFPREDISIDGSITKHSHGKQSKIDCKISTVPPLGLKKIIKVLTEGGEQYGPENYKLISSEDNIDHAVLHIINFLTTKNLDELSHAGARLVMGIDSVIRENDY